MLSNFYKILVLSFSMIWFCLLLFVPGNAFSQDDSAAPRKLVVGTVVAPPLYMKTAGSQWEGFSIDIWQAVAQHMGVLFEYREYSGLEPYPPVFTLFWGFLRFLEGFIYDFQVEGVCNCYFMLALTIFYDKNGRLKYNDSTVDVSCSG